MTLPRVTAILEAVGLGPDFSRVPPAVLEVARLRGTAVHEALEAEVYGYLTDVTPEVAPYLDAFRKFIAESQAQMIAAEVTVTHPQWQYVGHPDWVGWIGTQRMILDFKTGATDGAEYQLAAYAGAWNYEHPTELVTSAAVVELRDNGTYRFVEVDLPAASPVWLAAVTVFHAQRRAA